MGKPMLVPIGDGVFVIEYRENGETATADFVAALELSREQEKKKDFEGACNTRFISFQNLVDIVPEDEEVNLDWADKNSRAALRTGYLSGIDHFLACDWEMAAAIFEMVLDLDPEDHTESTVPLTYCYLAMEEFDSFDDIIDDVSDKDADKAILMLWNGYLRNGKIDEGPLSHFRSRFGDHYKEFVADTHPADAEYLEDIKGEIPSKKALARETWLQTEHLWSAFPAFTDALKQA